MTGAWEFRRRFAAVCFAALGCAGVADAKLVEQVVDLPVRVRTLTGETVEQSIKLTIFYDDARGRAPFLIINHGRAVSETARASFGRARYTAYARRFVELGFVVLAPTRIGYGVSGGPDAEFSGRACANRNYPAAFEAAATQVIRAIEHARTLPFVDASRGVIVGQSFGGATALAIAAKNLPEVKAVVNFAGGAGGNPDERPADPCSEDRLRALFASYGATARIPTLWLYSENDRFFGVEKPRQWLAAYRARGGSGEFVTLPPFGEDGHGSFTSNPQAWRQVVEAFLRRTIGAASDPTALR